MDEGATLQEDGTDLAGGGSSGGGRKVAYSPRRRPFLCPSLGQSNPTPRVAVGRSKAGGRAGDTASKAGGTTSSMKVKRAGVFSA